MSIWFEGWFSLRSKALSLVFLVLGALVLAQALQQANQYWTTGPTVKAQIWSIEQSVKALGEESGVSELVLQGKQMALEAQNIFLQTAVVDAILGIILVFIGVLYYPTEKPTRGGL
ncbi:MAG: hypothetical protein QW343_02105 [Candidatus Norongarragalinales archaeon]